jgi:hypothetical protein
MGCASQDHPRPTETPSSATPQRLIPAASGSFDDTDGNRYRDTCTLVVYIIADETRYPLPMKARGEFEIRLEDPNGKVIAKWNLGKDQVAASIRSLPPGPGYVFSLDLRASPTTGYTDKIDQGEAMMVVKFTPEHGEPIVARTSAPILIGPISTTGRPPQTSR